MNLLCLPPITSYTSGEKLRGRLSGFKGGMMRAIYGGALRS